MCSVVSDSLQPHGLQPTRLLCPWNSIGKNTGVVCHFLLQEIFSPRDQTRISCVSCIGRQILYQLSCATRTVHSSIVNAIQTQGRVLKFYWERNREAQQSYPKKVTVKERASVTPGGAGRKAQRVNRRVSLEKHPVLEASRCMSLRARRAQSETTSKFHKSLQHVLLGRSPMLQFRNYDILVSEQTLSCVDPGSSVHGISQVRILEWIAISSSKGFSDPWIELVSPALIGKFFTIESPGKPIYIHISTLLNSFPALVITEH